MKGFTLIAVIFGSILGGAVGGYGASQLAAPKVDTPVRKAAVLEGETGDDSTAKIDAQAKTIDDLNSKVAALNKRLDESEARKQDTAAIDKKIEDVNAKLDKVEKKVETQPAPTPGAPAVSGGAISQDDFNKMADAREKQKDEERQAAREKEMADRMAKRNAGIVDNMDKKLQLQPEQKEKLTKVLEAQNAKFADMGKKAQEARDAGLEFDWRKEMQTLSSETLTAVRNELTPAQQQTFDEATKESGMRAFEPQGSGWGGGMGPGGGGRRGGGGNGGGN